MLNQSKRNSARLVVVVRSLLAIVLVLLFVGSRQPLDAAPDAPGATIGGVSLGDLTNYLVFVADGSGKAKIQSASDGYAGDWAVNGTVATEETSGSFGYAGTIYTNDTGASAFGGWQDILDNNVGQAFGSTGNVALINSLKTTLNNAFTTINALPATPGYTSVSASSLNGLNTTDGVATTYVINVTSFSSTPMRITGDPGDVFIMRWDTDANFSNGYQGQVKFSGGDGIVPLGGLSPANFIHVAGDINSSGGGSPPTDFNFPLGPRTGNGQGPLPTGASNWPSSQGGGFFTGYWLTTGAPTNPPDANHSVRWGSSSSTSNGRIVGGWYSLTDNFTWTSGTSGVYIGPLDYGDLPEPKYLTTRKTSGQSGPAHVITSKLYIGTVFASDIDAEGNGQPNATATGDNTVNVNDEQGVTFPAFLAGQSANVTVQATNSTGKAATLYGFIDWNYDGDFADTGESATVSVPTGTAGNVVLTFNVPAGANTSNQLGARFRLSTAGGLGATDSPGANGPIPAPDGEVEDYLVSVSQPKDYGDAPDTGAGTGVDNYNTTASDSGPNHVIVNNLRLGAVAPDADSGTLQNAAATADDTNNTDDEDGVTTLPAVTTTSTSVPLTVSVFNNTGSSATVACWIDFNRDGVFSNTGERASATVSSSASQQNINLTFTGFTAPTAGTSYLRCRLANASGEVANPTGAAASGEVEDYQLTIANVLDYGDAPDTGAGTGVDNYNTTAGDSGPSHVIVSNLRLGAVAPDADSGTLQNTAATADDTDNTDDEDGVTTLPTVTTASTSVPLTVSVFNNTGSDATVACWIDFNRDGDFVDTGERASATVSSSASQQNINLTFTGFATPTAGASYLRCRIANASGEVANPTGLAASGEVEDSLLFIVNTPGSIGNYVWTDENSDGYQDTGEPGLPNVRVDLKNCTNGAILATTYTDAQGGYLFGNLVAGTYCVKVDASTVPTGMVQTPYNLPGADFGNQDQSGNGYQIVLPTGGENLTADFGYNNNPTNCVDGDPSCADDTATIGDRVWVDANGNGRQDPEEVGISGVLVTLYTDPDGDGIYSTPAGTDTTDDNGNYLFDGLTPDTYAVVVTPPSGYTQTGDPDDFGSPAINPDNKTTAPVVLAPGDVFLNADFGYQPIANSTGTIGDRVWLDLDADGVQDGGEPGIPGVTVVLIRDSNANGQWDSGEPIIGNDLTDGSGNYLFSGLPVTDGSGTDDYLVWVNDTNNLLANLRPTFDADGVNPAGGLVTGLGISSVLDLTTTPVLTQDFGYTPTGQENDKGLIGDRVWLDINGDGAQDADEPGIEGVQVTLRDNAGNTLGITETDENGNYYFGGLPAGTYSVTVTPPSGMTQTYDATAPLDNESNVTIPTGGINLDQDFGYRGTGTVGDLVWRDLNANGSVDSGETGISGVTLDLYWDLDGDGTVDAGEPRVGNTTTDGSGGYLFSGLPTDDGSGNSQFVVDVTDRAGVLAGYAQSLGTPNTNNNSQTDPYAVTLTPGAPNYLFADFGYYATPAALGNFVWYDVNNNGLQEANEPGIDGVKVTLTAKYFGGVSYTFSTVTGDDPATATVEKGWYSFGNLLLDEDNASSKTGTPTATQPVYTLSVPTGPSGFTSAQLNQGSNDMIDADDPTGVDGLATQGQEDVAQNVDANSETAPIAGYDFGYFMQPYALSKNLTSFTPIRNGELITFTIRITNTGILTLTTVPLTDTYDTTYLAYAGSTPTSEDNLNDGNIDWNDLTSSTHGFGVDLAPGQSFVVVVNFVGIEDTTELTAQSPCTLNARTCNVAMASGVLYDPDGPGPLPEQGPLPPQSDHDDVEVVVPTAVALADRMVRYTGVAVDLGWRTINESDLVGFLIYRQEYGGELVKLTDTMIQADRAGQSDGSSYTYTDETIQAGKRYSYMLEFIGMERPLGQAVMGEVTAGALIFIPSLQR